MYTNNTLQKYKYSDIRNFGEQKLVTGLFLPKSWYSVLHNKLVM